MIYQILFLTWTIFLVVHTGYKAVTTLSSKVFWWMIIISATVSILIINKDKGEESATVRVI